jgi:hypothetical protein
MCPQNVRHNLGAFLWIKESSTVLSRRAQQFDLS